MNEAIEAFRERKENLELDKNRLLQECTILAQKIAEMSKRSRHKHEIS